MSAPPRLPNAPPANDPPQLRTFEAIATEFGFKNTRAVRNWCVRRAVAYWRDGGFSWVDRNAVVAAITRKGAHVVKVDPPPPTVGAWVDATLGGTRRG